MSLRFSVMGEDQRADRDGHGGLTPNRSPVLLQGGRRSFLFADSLAPDGLLISSINGETQALRLHFSQ